MFFNSVADDAGFHLLLQQFAELKSAVTERVFTPEVPFSDVRSSHFARLCTQRNIRTSFAALPDLSRFIPAEPPPFEWHSQWKENDKAGDLSLLLEDWVVQDDAVPRGKHYFHDVHSDRSQLLTIDEPGAGRFSGVPDLFILREGLGPDLPYLSTAAVIVDWKTKNNFTAAAKKEVASRQMAVLAIASAAEGAVGLPVFFTDLHSGMRCMLYLNGSLYQFHQRARDLTLQEGIGLIRYFLATGGDLLPDDQRKLQVHNKHHGDHMHTIAEEGEEDEPVAHRAGAGTAGSARSVPTAGGKRHALPVSNQSSPEDPHLVAAELALYFGAAVADVQRVLGPEWACE